MKITLSIEDEEGGILIEKTSDKAIPYLDEFDKQGFRKSFDQLETAVLEARKEISDEAVKEYMELISKKKQIVR